MASRLADLSLDRRLARLEHKRNLGQMVLVWRRMDQTDDEALATRFPDGVPAGVRVIVMGWIMPETAETRGLA